MIAREVKDKHRKNSKKVRDQHRRDVKEFVKNVNFVYNKHVRNRIINQKWKIRKNN
jgi:hypothetical protein